MTEFEFLFVTIGRYHGEDGTLLNHEAFHTPDERRTFIAPTWGSALDMACDYAEAGGYICHDIESFTAEIANGFVMAPHIAAAMAA